MPADLNSINEFNVQPGPYKHYKGAIYVVFTIVTHMDSLKGKMEPLEDPLVCYRDLMPIKRHVQGRMQEAHQVYARPLSEFIGIADKDGQPVKRFTRV